MNTPCLWTPTEPQITSSYMMQFMHLAEKHSGLPFSNYDDLWQWSISDRSAFWNLIWDALHVIGDKGEGAILENGDDMLHSRWFSSSRLNYAENLLNPNPNLDNKTAMVFWGENKIKSRISHRELFERVAQYAKALQLAGVVMGDCVAGYLPNRIETMVAMLATVSIGAIWTSASPDFGEEAVLDRFGQTKPRVVFCTDGYWYNGKEINCMQKNRAIVTALPNLLKVVFIPYLNKTFDLDTIPHALSIDDFLAPCLNQKEINFARVPFTHPLFIMYSSGTTGIPKCIVHGHGGVLLQHLKEHRLHGNLDEKSSMLFYTTCGWMMWNWLASILALKCTILLYDGSPFLNNGNILFDYAAAEHATHLGAGAKFFDACAKENLSPKNTHDFSALSVIFSTGSPLIPERFSYIYDAIKPNVQLSSISGGTDIISCFALGNPMLPVYQGEIQCKGLGLAVDVFDENGKSIAAEHGKKGELVCTRSFPSQPIYFFGDTHHEKYKAAYFSHWPNVWCHGDFVATTPRGGLIIYGRSDATLNPGGVRIGAAEIYRQVEALDEVLESIVVGQDYQGDVRIILFIKLRPTLTLDSTLIEKIKQHIRSTTTSHHVPAKIIQVSDLPRTKNGKVAELAVRHAIHGHPIKNLEALANPTILDIFKNLIELQ